VLNGLFGTATAGATPSTSSGVAPAIKPITATTSGFGGAGMAAGAQSGGTSTVQGSGLTSFALNASLRVMADEINNAVLVYGARSEYEKIEATLKRLDVPPTQVLIEASIIEVTLTDDLKYGLQWVFNDTARGSAGLLGTGMLSTAPKAV